MQTKTTEKSPNWVNWFRGLPANQIRAVRDRITNECDISLATFYRWANGYSDVPKLAQEKIQQIAERELDFSFHPIEQPSKVRAEE